MVANRSKLELIRAIESFGLSFNDYHGSIAHWHSTSPSPHFIPSLQHQNYYAARTPAPVKTGLKLGEGEAKYLG